MEEKYKRTQTANEGYLLNNKSLNYYCYRQRPRLRGKSVKCGAVALHKSGARKVALTGIGPIGCTPIATAAFERDGSLCVDYMNDAVDLFNDGLKSLVTKLNKHFTDSKFVYLNTYGLIFSRYPLSPGIELGIAGCCPVNEYGLCIPKKPSCRLRDLRLFWDSFHPTESANKVGAVPSYLALRSYLISELELKNIRH